MNMTTDDWWRVASGFDRILWSVPFGMLLFSGVLRLNVPTVVRFPPYVLAVILFISGLRALSHVHLDSAKWRLYLRLGYAAAALLLYLSPFAYWLSQQPYQNYFVVHYLLLIVLWTLTLWVVNGLVEEVALCTGNSRFRIEVRIGGGLVLALMTIPVVVFSGYVLWYGLRYDVLFILLIQEVRYYPHVHWFFAIGLAPLSLTLLNIWKAKQNAMQALTMPSRSSTGTAPFSP